MKRIFLIVLASILLMALALPAAAYTRLSMQMGPGDPASEPVRALQTALQALGYPVDLGRDGQPSGVYTSLTHQAVVGFQQRNGLQISGVADDAMQRKLFGGGAAPYSTPVATLPADEGKIGGPAASSVQLLHWYKEVKNKVKSGNSILIYHPGSGISYNLRILDPGFHIDAEPKTFRDTQLMNRAFGREARWNIEVVYVKLPDGRWSLATTHNYPHMTTTIHDNGFGGHLCVHFLRELEETKRNSNEYNMDHQMRLRSAWKSLTGITLPDYTVQETYAYIPMTPFTGLMGMDITGKAMDPALAAIAQDAAQKAAAENLAAYEVPGYNTIALVQSADTNSGVVILREKNPAIADVEKYGLGGVRKVTYADGVAVDSSIYWYFLGTAATGGSGLPGDANNDKAVDILDLVSIIDYIVAGQACESMANANANGDAAVDILDLVWIINHIVGG